MPTYTPKMCRERAEKYETSWQVNAPNAEFADITLASVKADRQAVLEKEDELAAAEARVSTLKIERDGMNVSLMKNLDYVARAVEASRDYGPDSALYGGFGYIRESEKKRSGGRKKA